MKVVGIIVEYNPFHNGHLHHLSETITKSKKDILIAVTAGNVVMRGDISCINKFDKAKIAVDNGVDLVIELPAVDTLQSSDHFAKSAIKILGELGCSEIYFGSESNDITQLTNISNAISTDSYRQKLKEYLSNGYSYSVASNKVLQDLYNYQVNSNDILGISYISAIRQLGYHIRPYTIKRKGTAYNDNSKSSNEIASASFIRDNRNYKGYVPSNTLFELDRNGFMDINKIFHLLRYQTITSSTCALEYIMHVKEGIEYKIKKIVPNSFDELVEQLTSKRYNKAYIRRLLLSILFNISKGSNDNFYIRILGYNNIGSSYIKQISKNKNLNIYRKLKDNISLKTDIEISISKILSTSYNTFDYRKEYKEPYYLNLNTIKQK